MNQVVQNFKTGELSVQEVPPPVLTPGFVLVRNEYSLISAGTERATVSAAKASLLGKARQRPDLVRQVLDTLKRDGISETWKRVRTKLETLKELGYSSAGVVMASMDTHGAFRPGDRVACGGGGYACHAGIVSVPQNLVVKVPAAVPLNAAAFTTLGAIAMQGVRQASPRLGEYVAVIGLGLLGQITAQILRANGCQVFGIDTSPAMVALAAKASCHAAIARGEGRLESEIDFFTEGHGFDSVIITAAAQSADPIELATSILRQKGRVVVVGAVPMNIPREPHFYRKELELKISCSYGPGRYDRGYEEEGKDYPYGYVRWTENRNMAAFVKLLDNKSVDVAPLITHEFDIEEAEKAYDIVSGAVKEKHIAMLLKYPAAATNGTAVMLRQHNEARTSLEIGFIGAGSFAQKYLIPAAKTMGSLRAVVTQRGVSAKNVGKKFQFAEFSTNPEAILASKTINTVFIATRHDTHGKLALASLEAGKHVFVEKPLTLQEGDLEQIAESASHPGAGKLIVGYNRRFAPLAQEARKAFEGMSEPLLINYRVNAGFIPLDHWTQTEQGGGRILGEVCHFVDFLQFLTGDRPQKVSAESVATPNSKMASNDNVVITVRFERGAVGLITYLACGDKSVAKERIEIFGGGKTFIIQDFQSGEFYKDGRRSVLKLPGKGHQQEVEAFLTSVREGAKAPISLESLLATSTSTFRILDSLRTGLPQAVARV